MKIKVEPGRVIRLTPRTNTSLRRGGEYDLDALGVPPEQQKAILALEGVSQVKGSPAAKPTESGKGGGES